MTRLLHSSPVRARGFGLIEVLITLLVFSIGVLAVAGLQAISRKNNFDALQRTTAANLAESIFASMRANTTALDAYLVPVANPRGSHDEVAVPNDCYQAECTPSEMAAFDLAQWEYALDGAGELLVDDSGEGPATALKTGGLASPSACILGPATGGAGRYTVVIAWRGVAELPGNAGHACGTGRGLYGTEADADSLAYQRFFSLQTYISP